MRKLDDESLKKVKAALAEYEREVMDTKLKPPTQRTYLAHANTFVRWLEGDFKPGLHVK